MPTAPTREKHPRNNEFPVKNRKLLTGKLKIVLNIEKLGSVFNLLPEAGAGLLGTNVINSDARGMRF